MRRVICVLLIIAGSTGIFVASLIWAVRHPKSEKIDRLPMRKRYVAGNAFMSAVGLTILAWDALWFWLLW